MQHVGVITITTRATARQRPTTLSRRHAVAAGPARVVSTATYWKRRLVVVLLAVALVLVMARAGAALGGSTPAAPERHPAHTSAASTIVRPGDSLWTVAERLVPGDDPRPVVDALSEARHGTVLTPGESISWDG
jgi:hypothetical protein